MRELGIEGRHDARMDLCQPSPPRRPSPSCWADDRA
jgi:hypothetical protein